MVDADIKSYKDSLKATSLFGGVQIYNILITIIRSKVIAILLGTTGMGINGLYISTVSFLNSLTAFGLGQSSIKYISEANAMGKNEEITKVIVSLRKMVWYTGFLGTFLCLVLSPYLSLITFGNYKYTIGFAIVSCTLLFQQLTSGQTALLQGLHKYKYMAKANLIGSTVGLLVAIPLYYLFRIDAIIPVLVLTNLISLLLSTFFSKKIKVDQIAVSNKEIKKIGGDMIKMGFMISLSGLISYLVSYLVRVYISNRGGIDQVGLYTAGFAIINTYVGLVFTAMSTDYFPRLSEVNNDQTQFNNVLNNQMEIALLLLAPIIVIFIIFVRYMIIILYSSDFLLIENFLYWSIFAIYFKAISWCIAFSYLAKGDSKLFFINEFSAGLYTLVCNIFCYSLWGISGLGISYLILYIIYAFQVWVICRIKYNISLRKNILKIFIKQLPITVICFCFVLLSPFLKYSLGSIFIILSCIISYKEINKRVNLKSIFIKKYY